MLLNVFFIVIFFICLAMLWNEGLWSNTISLINVVFAAMLATNYFEPLATFLYNLIPTYSYFCDFLAMWIIFFFAALILRTATDVISKHRVKFKLPVEMIGRAVMAAWVAWMMIGFTSVTLQVAPLAKHSFRGAFQQTPTSGNFFGMAPGRQWLSFMQSRSRGSLSQTEVNEFDPRSEFILKYGARREKLEGEAGLRVNVKSGDF